MKNITKNYTIKKRTFAARFETDPIKRAKLNADTLTSEYSPQIKYQLVFNFTEFGFETKKQCVDKLIEFGIPIE